jgi:hypothetical protein
MTEIVDELRELLVLYDIADSEYTDEQLEMMISQARACIGTEYTEASDHEDYVRDFCGDYYLTDYYPVDVDSVRVTIDDEIVFPEKITSEGIIYFTNQQRGKLSCTYVQDFSSYDIKEVILPLTMYMIRDKNGGNMRSINEGDISITYDNDSQLSTSNMISQLVQKLQNKYKARVRLL